MQLTKAIVSTTIIAILVTSCSHRLVGTWTVQNYQTETPGNEGTSLSNIGTITFNKDRSGSKKLDFKILGIQKNDTVPFEWTATENFVTIKGENSALVKTWIYIENKSKSQKWQATDGANTVQTLEMVKQ
ncbi:MAG: lipocalin family protein [Flavobacteriaceae bacterium]